MTINIIMTKIIKIKDHKNLLLPLNLQNLLKIFNQKTQFLEKIK